MKFGIIKKSLLSILSFLLLFSVSDASSSPIKLRDWCKRWFAPQTSNSSFIDFAKEHLGKRFSTEIDSKWDLQIKTAAKNWTTKEAEDFLYYLKTRIGEKATMKHIQNDFSYFELSRYKKFRQTVSFYEGYLGEEIVTQHLKNSLRGFFYNDSLSNLRQVVTFVDFYLKLNTKNSEENDNFSLKKIMIQNINFFARANIRELKASVRFLEKHIGKKEVQKKMKEDFRYFYRFFSRNKLEKLHKQLKSSQREKIPVPHYFSSWAEAELFWNIAREGYWIVPKYEISKIRINLVIIGYKKKLTVEYDEKSNSSEDTGSTKKQDMLESLGWESWKINSNDFNKNKNSTLKDLWEHLEEMRIYPLNTWANDEFKMQKTQNQNLFKKLQDLRMEIAQEQNGIPYFAIFTTDTLKEMSMRTIRDKKQLLEIKGVTPEKLELYGHRFLKVMKEHYDQELHKKLTKLRWDISLQREKDSSVSTIFINEVLIEMSKKPTRNKETLLKIEGVTREKLELYGDQFLKVMKEHLDQELLNTLKSLRWILSNEKNIPASSIFSNKILEEMVNQLIQDKDQLLKITGVGPKKLEQYGDLFLQVIREHLNMFP